jgi:hypothetical protein
MRRLNAITLAQSQGHRRPRWNRRDLLVDGRPLEEHIEVATKRAVDYVSPLGWTNPDYEQWYRDQVLLRVESGLPSGRYVLLVCPICADLGCGCISADIELADGVVTWRQFGFENDYSTDVEPLGWLSFAFELEAYRAALAG